MMGVGAKNQTSLTYLSASLHKLSSAVARSNRRERKIRQPPKIERAPKKAKE